MCDRIAVAYEDFVGTSQASFLQHNILHVCTRDNLRPLRDEILRRSGFRVESTANMAEGLNRVKSENYDLVLVDVPNSDAIARAEALCSDIKTADPQQLVAFVCNWFVAGKTDCPDDVLRTDFDPQRFLAGVQTILSGGRGFPSA